jgi:hypothetical protein
MRIATWVIFGTLLLTGALTADARMPAVGDWVNIKVPGVILVTEYIGTITDVDENMITLNCTYIGNVNAAGAHEVSKWDANLSVCVGKGSILSLTWP